MALVHRTPLPKRDLCGGRGGIFNILHLQPLTLLDIELFISGVDMNQMRSIFLQVGLRR
jgi:hypothetical protein